MGHIRDDMITASSSRDGNVNPKNARLYSPSAWVANTNDKNQYLQVRLFTYLLIEYSYILLNPNSIPTIEIFTMFLYDKTFLKRSINTHTHTHTNDFYTNCTFLVRLLMLLEVIL